MFINKNKSISLSISDINHVLLDYSVKSLLYVNVFSTFVDYISLYFVFCFLYFIGTFWVQHAPCGPVVIGFLLLEMGVSLGDE